MCFNNFRIIPIVLLFCFLFSSVEAQSFRRQTIGSLGSSGMIDGITISHTVGQSFSTATYFGNNFRLNPGFQQGSFMQRQVEIADLPENISVYPNPASSYILFETSQSIRELNLKVTDLNGKIIFSAFVPDLKDYELNCADWPAGMYAIIITGNDYTTSFTSKLIITK